MVLDEAQNIKNFKS